MAFFNFLKTFGRVKFEAKTTSEKILKTVIGKTSETSKMRGVKECWRKAYLIYDDRQHDADNKADCSFLRFYPKNQTKIIKPASIIRYQIKAHSE